MGKLTISMAIFNSKLLVYQRVLFFSATWKLLPPSHVRQRMIHYEFVNGKDDIPDMMESHKIHVPNHQPAKYDCQKSSEHLLELPSNSEVFQVLLGNDIVLTALGVTGWEFPRVQLAMVRTCEKVERSRKKHNMLVVVMHCILPRKNVDDRWCNKNWDVPTWCGWCVHMCMCLCTCVCICIHVYVYVYVYIYVIHIYIYSSMYYTSIKLHCHLLLCLDSTFIGSGFHVRHPRKMLLFPVNWDVNHADSTTTTHFGDPPNNVGFIFGAYMVTNHLENKATCISQNSHESAPSICCLKFQAMFSEKCK